MFFKGLIGLEDFFRDTAGTGAATSIRKSDGGNRNITGVNASHLPLLAATRGLFGYNNQALNANDVDAAIVQLLSQLNGIHKFANQDILKEIASFGSKAIITDAERSKLASITDIGSGAIITTAERAIIAGVDTLISDMDALEASLNSILPVGSVVAFPTNNIPASFMELDGRLLDRAIYSDLYAAMGSSPKYGFSTVNDFYLPDYRGQFLRGWDHGRTLDPGAANRTDRGDGTTGDNPGTIQADEVISHAHTHTGGGDWLPAGVNQVGNGDGASVTVFTSSSVGGDETRPKNISVVWCIRYENP